MGIVERYFPACSLGAPARVLTASINSVLIRAATTPPGRIYDITGERVPLEQVIAIVRDRLPQADIEIGPGTLDGFDRQGPIAVNAADRELGYRPRWGLASGIDDLCAWRESKEAC